MRRHWSSEHEGRRIEAIPIDTRSGYRLDVLLDGEVVAEGRARSSDLTVRADGLTVKAKLAWHGMTIVRAEVVPDEGDPLPLEPDPGTWAARRERFARRHPGAYAARHAAAGVSKVVVPLVALVLLPLLLPEIDLRLDLDIDLPLPDIPWPTTDLPPVPGWIRAIGESARYWGPIVTGIALAIAEYRRRRRPDPGHSEPDPDHGEPDSTPPSGRSRT